MSMFTKAFKAGYKGEAAGLTDAEQHRASQAWAVQMAEQTKSQTKRRIYTEYAAKAEAKAIKAEQEEAK